MAILHNMKDVLKVFESLKVTVLFAPALVESSFLEDFNIKLLDGDGMQVEIQDQDLNLFLEELNNLKKSSTDFKLCFTVLLLEVLILHNIYPISPELVKYREEVDKEVLCGVNSVLKPIGEAFNREKENVESDEILPDNDRSQMLEDLSKGYDSFLRVSRIFQYYIEELREKGRIFTLADKGSSSSIDINTLEDLFEKYVLINCLVVQLCMIYDPIIALDNSSNFSCGLPRKEPPKKK